VLTLLGIILAFLRVILGVHLVRDVLAGLLCAILSAVIGYIMI
jgi:membrane-associated phospholipid phosphatase